MRIPGYAGGIFALGHFEMTLSDLAALGSFVSGVAVLVTLVFLLLQMRQANHTLKAQMQQGRSERLMGPASLLADPYHSALWVRAASGDVNFTSAEVSSFIRMQATWFWSYEDTFHQHRSGALDAAGWRTDLASLQAMAAEPGSRAAWRLLRLYADGPYAEFVDQLMRDTKSSVLPDLSQHWKAVMTEEWTRAGNGAVP